MVGINLVGEQQALGKVKSIYGQIKSSLGVDFVPKIFQAIALMPAYLEAEYSAYKKIMEQGQLPRADKELIGHAVAATKASAYMAAMQLAMCKKEGLDDEAIVEAMGVVDFYNGFDAFADALHVDPDLQPPRIAPSAKAQAEPEPKVHFPYVDEPQDEIGRRVYADIKKTFAINFVPNIFKSLGHLPGVLEAKWAKYKAIMVEGKLKRTTKELLAVAVSAVNACEY